MRMPCHKTETRNKQQTDMNLLVTDVLYLLHAARNSYWTFAKKYKCSSNSLDLYIVIVHVIGRGHARRDTFVTIALQTCFYVLFTRLVLNTRKVTLVSQ
jgi:hypothetical protein